MTYYAAGVGFEPCDQTSLFFLYIGISNMEDLPMVNDGTNQRRLAELRSQRQANAGMSYRDRYQAMLSAYEMEVRDAFIRVISSNGLKWSRRNFARNSVMYGSSPQTLHQIIFEAHTGAKLTFTISLISETAGNKTIVSRDMADADPYDVAIWTWKNLPSAYKQ